MVLPITLPGKARRVLDGEEAFQAGYVGEVVGDVITRIVLAEGFLESFAQAEGKGGDQGVLTHVGRVRAIFPNGENYAVPVQDEFISKRSRDEAVDEVAGYSPLLVTKHTDATDFMRICRVADGVPADIVEASEEEHAYIEPV